MHSVDCLGVKGCINAGEGMKSTYYWAPFNIQYLIPSVFKLQQSSFYLECVLMLDECFVL